MFCHGGITRSYSDSVDVPLQRSLLLLGVAGINLNWYWLVGFCPKLHELLGAPQHFAVMRRHGPEPMAHTVLSESRVWYEDDDDVASVASAQEKYECQSVSSLTFKGVKQKLVRLCEVTFPTVH